MSKQIHVCPICFRSNYDHTGLEVATCKSQMKKKSTSLPRAHFSEVVKALAKKLQNGLCNIGHMLSFIISMTDVVTVLIIVLCYVVTVILKLHSWIGIDDE